MIRFDRETKIATLWTAAAHVAAKWAKLGYPVQVGALPSLGTVGADCDDQGHKPLDPRSCQEQYALQATERIMIDKQTVFVLGAGASIPYGFPSGSKLVTDVCASLSAQNGPAAISIRGAGDVGPEEPARFAELLKQSGFYSIDAFVQRRPEFARVAKLAIAHELLKYEVDDKLDSAGSEHDWCRYLFNQILPTDGDNLRAIPLQIVTFNFDRSFEHALYRTVKATYPTGDSALLSRAIAVLHVHGQLGWLPWAKPDEGEVFTRHYAPDNGAEILNPCADDIKIVGEETRETFRRAQEWLSNAEQVCFLGFGYHETNLAALGAKRLRTHFRSTMGTRYGLEQGIAMKIQAKFDLSFLAHVDREWDILKFLKETSVIHA